MASFDKLSQSINDNSQPVATRRAAVIEFAEIGGEEALNYILQALTDDAPGVRREAAIALQKYSSSDVTHALLDAIKTEDNDLTLWTQMEVLGNIGSMTALPVLQDLINSTLSPLTRRVVEKSIDQITSRLPNNESDEPVTSQDLESAKPQKSAQTNKTHLVSKQPYEDEQIQDDNTVEVEVEQHFTQTSDENIEEQIESNEVEAAQLSEDAEISVDDVNTEQDQISEETSQDNESSEQELDESSETNTDTNTDALEDLKSEENRMLKSGTSPSLPVLVPNTSVVVYQSEEQHFRPGVFDLVLRPTAYLSKRWVSRTRLYLVLLCLLVVAAFSLVYSQVQRRPRSPYRPNAAIAFMENPEKYLNAGIFFIQEGDYHSAIETLEFLRGVNSINIELYRYLGYAYFKEHLYASAIESYEYYLSSQEENTYQPFVAEASYQGNGDDMERSADYMTYIFLGTAYKRLGDFHKAREIFEAAIKMAPLEAEAYSKLAQLYTDGFQQKHVLAEALASTAVSINPDISSYHDTLGWLHIKNERLHKGTDTLKHAIRLQSDYIPAHYHLSSVAQRIKNSDSTISIVKKDLIDRLRPTNNPRSDMIKVLSYIYETESENIPKYNPSLLPRRILRK